MAGGLEGTTTTTKRGSTREPGRIWGGAVVATEAMRGRWWWRGKIVVEVVLSVSDATGHAEIANTAYTHLID